MASAIPTSPPQRTSLSLRLFMPKSAPAAPGGGEEADDDLDQHRECRRQVSVRVGDE